VDNIAQLQMELIRFEFIQSDGCGIIVSQESRHVQPRQGL
jgi:hypothetical protein